MRNAAQRELTGTLGTVGATHVRFLFGCPFALLFLLAVLSTGAALPHPGWSFWPWMLGGALMQIAATALMLAAMGERSFVVAIAYIKTEPVQVALFGFVFLGDAVSARMAAAIAIATAGVIVMSIGGARRPEGNGRAAAGPRPRTGALRQAEDRQPREGGAAPQAKSAKASDRPLLGNNPLFGLRSLTSVLSPPTAARSAAVGLAAGAAFALSAIGYRGGILSLAHPDYVMAATFTMAAGLIVQSALLSLYLAARDPAVLAALARAWRPSLFAGFMGALATQFWFLAFALATAASVRTLALVEVLFAQAISHFVFRQPVSRREGVGICLIVAGVVLLVAP